MVRYSFGVADLSRHTKWHSEGARCFAEHARDARQRRDACFYQPSGVSHPARKELDHDDARPHGPRGPLLKEVLDNKLTALLGELAYTDDRDCRRYTKGAIATLELVPAKVDAPMAKGLRKTA